MRIDHSLPPTFSKVLIANRGEIACRVIRTAKQLGIKTVAVYSDADDNAMHVNMADEAYRLGDSPVTKSYLRGDKIIEIAASCGADAIHPGYGFLSENVCFSRQCADANIEFIGPPSTAIESMASKSAAKSIMMEAGVPVIPGYHGDDQSSNELLNQAKLIGFPIMIKAALGGGGKGMRIASTESSFLTHLDACKRESLSSFADDRILLERYIEKTRHVELQIFADKHGSALHLLERDCSVQRRHQKVLEEAPAPGMSTELRGQMGQAAVDAVKAVGYVGAGTVEFMIDVDTNEFYYLETNTRLQVEHPVTEMITGKDLVQLQFHVAAGHKLPFTQQDIIPNGHAIEARIYAENPTHDFLPCTGVVHDIRLPDQRDNRVRIDTGIAKGSEISVFYDPMIAKLIVWDTDRNSALSAMLCALQNFQICGVTTNIAFLHRAVLHPSFNKGAIDTSFIDTHLHDLISYNQTPSKNIIAMTALVVVLSRHCVSSINTEIDSSPWNLGSSFRVNAQGCERVQFTLINDDSIELDDSDEMSIGADVQLLRHTDNSYRVLVNGENDDDSFNRVTCSYDNASGVLTMRTQSMIKQARFVRKQNDIDVFCDGEHHKLRTDSESAALMTASSSHSSDDKAMTAPMPGKVIEVKVKTGDCVEKDDALVVVEAMKMEHIIRASRSGSVKDVHCVCEQFVERGVPLITLDEK